MVEAVVGEEEVLAIVEDIPMTALITQVHGKMKDQNLALITHVHGNI